MVNHTVFVADKVSVNDSLSERCLSLDDNFVPYLRLNRPIATGGML